MVAWCRPVAGHIGVAGDGTVHGEPAFAGLRPSDDELVAQDSLRCQGRSRCVPNLEPRGFMRPFARRSSALRPGHAGQEGRAMTS